MVVLSGIRSRRYVAETVEVAGAPDDQSALNARETSASGTEFLYILLPRLLRNRDLHLPPTIVFAGPLGSLLLRVRVPSPRSNQSLHDLSESLFSSALKEKFFLLLVPTLASQLRKGLGNQDVDSHGIWLILLANPQLLLTGSSPKHQEGLRGPKEYTLDYPEVFAQMADLSGGVPATSNGTATPMSRPIAARAPAPTGSPGIKGPRAIMQERAAREERQRLERERLEREHAEAEARAAEEALQKERERRAAAAAAAGAGPVPSGTGVDASSTRRPTQTSTDRAKADDGNRAGAYPKVPGDSQAQGAQRHTRGTSAPTQPIPGATTPGTTSGNQPPPPESSTSARGSQARNAFPHAFERWEALSAHWEGLTNFWIRRLEQNAQQISNDPVSQQLARQVTDLSSAGANLFHAVVELQRLRASSERKFQRWFFETRTELERQQEIAAMLEAALQEERRTRGDAIRKALEKEKGTSKLEKQLAEMRKELLISKEEARRAWEELGRREQEERDRTASLQQGHPTIVGGVQVVPMTQSAGRGDSQRDPRSYGQAEPSNYTRSPTSRAAHPDYTQAPAVQPTPASASGGGAYQSESAVHHQQSYGSEGYSDEDFETPATQPEVYRPTGGGTHQPQYSATPDYSGAGYSSGWEEIEQMPRHHHPTRLSDVIEEDDERSRTSASQVGRV
ncbi:hypothetical protein DL769_010628 [Monosporascus sp. CRB-8-3]|nr:hypothetical protein DL769_010628 [Monosporascus sp. CRB-8-3]